LLSRPRNSHVKVRKSEGKKLIPSILCEDLLK
jgi:hypothetical protein